jgi:uncharacterized protein YabN with tetrapyrrole methylase and pyrophosphatase domain
MKKNGTLVNVGLGMTLGSHISPLSRSYIEKADIVFVAASNKMVEEWVMSMNDNVVSLQDLYHEGTSRAITYHNMVSSIMDAVREGKNVCGAFYGHPGVFAWAPHETIKIAKEEGYTAHMEAGISAEDCLYADLGIDPGTYGCFHIEATQYMFKKKIIDPTSYLVLWQVGVAGDKSLAKFSIDSQYKQVLVDMLVEIYPENHEITLYECAVLPIEYARIEKIMLKDLAKIDISLKTTVVLPPLNKPEENIEILNKVEKITKGSKV